MVPDGIHPPSFRTDEFHRHGREALWRFGRTGASLSGPRRSVPPLVQLADKKQTIQKNKKKAHVSRPMDNLHFVCQVRDSEKKKEKKREIGVKT